MIETGASDDPAVEKKLDQILTQLYGFYHDEIDLSLDRVTRFLERLGNPHLNLPKTIHVAGTNGKGSIIATIRSALEACGLTVHCATSPHLVHPTERIRLAGKLIESRHLVALLEECLSVNRDEPITFFEMFMAASFLAFSRTPADYLLLETGMGGRLDATNVITPVCTVITMISKDHEAFLGNTLRQIAFEKAGIMKPGIPCVIGYQSGDPAQISEIMGVFQERSQALSPPAKLVRAGAEWRTEDESTLIRFCAESDEIHVTRPSLLGSHQIRNAGAALAAFRIVEPDHFNEKILSTALSRIEWPGRLQRLTQHRFNDLAPGQWEIIIDGGHNDSAGQILADQAAAWARDDGKPLHLIVAMVDRKDAAAFLKPLAPYAASLTVTEIPDEPHSYTADALYNLAKPLGFKNLTKAATPEDAVTLIAQANNQKESRILICGSLYLIGNVLKEKAA